MILKEFSKYIQTKDNDIIHKNSSAAKILCDWIKLVINKNPKGHVDKIVHKEIMLAQNKADDYFIIAKSESGRVLLKALYNYAQSYEHYILSKWLIDKNPKDFNQ